MWIQIIRRKKKIIDASMLGFQECKKLWKQETFREFVAEKKKDHDIEKYNIEISILTELRDQLVCEKFEEDFTMVKYEAYCE